MNKWQRQKEKNYQCWLEEQEYQCQQKKERYERKQAKSHWNCPFFRDCWNKGLKLPTRSNCPKCSKQYWKFRQSQANRRSIHAQDEYHHNNMAQCLKIEVFMISLESELLIKTGLIMEKKIMKKNMFGKKGNGVQEV